MLANLSKDVGVIVFTNTSLSGVEERHPIDIFLELWKRAEALKKERRRSWSGIAAPSGPAAPLKERVVRSRMISTAARSSRAAAGVRGRA
jgi:hypothetical protein